MKALALTRLLIGAFGLLIGALFIVGWQGVSHLSQLNTQMQIIVGDQWKEVQITHEAFQLSENNNQIILTVFFLDDENEIKALLAKRATQSARITELMHNLEPRLNPNESRLFAAVKATRTPYLESYQQALALLLVEKKPDEARKMMMDAVRPKLVTYHEAWKAFDRFETAEIDQFIQETNADYVNGRREFLITLVLAGVMTSAIAIFTVRRMGREIAIRQFAEQSLHEANEQLEQRVLERTADLKKTNDELQIEIIERKRAEESLQLLGAAVQQTNDSIVITDADLNFPGPRILFANPAFTTMTGYSEKEVLGQSPRLLQGPRTDKAVLGRLRQNLQRGESFEGEVINYRKDGKEFYLEWQITPIRNARDEITHFVAVQHDITERKLLEASLLQSQKMETMGRIAGGVAHEFNSILTAIIGRSDMLLKDLPPNNLSYKNAREIRQAAERAASLTRQLLAYGRKQILQPEILDLNRIISDMAETLPHLIGREVELRIVPSAGLKTVKIDPGQIEQVIVKMALNAAEAMPRGGTLTLATSSIILDEEFVRPFPGLKPGEYVLLVISDTGTGMSEEVKARAFEPFFSTKGVGEGTGLGLATCYGIIKQSNGHIELSSEAGKGTTFKIYLPQAIKKTTNLLPHFKSHDLPRGTETILLAEDDPSLLEMAAGLLNRLGYSVLTAVNGIEALNVTNQPEIGRIDLIFTDVDTPHMSDSDMADHLRELYPRTKILFTSAYAASAMVHKTVLKEGVMFLQKPFTPSALAYKVREVLDQPSPS